MTAPSSMPPQGDLFAAAPPIDVVMRADARPALRAGGRAERLFADIVRSEQSAELRRLEPVAVAVGFARASFTMADVRTEAERLGILTGNEGRPDPGTGRMQNPRALAYLGALLPGLARIGFVRKVSDAEGRTVYTTSGRDRANCNKQALWQLSERGRIAHITAEGSAHVIAEIILAYRESGASDLPPSPRP